MKKMIKQALSLWCILGLLLTLIPSHADAAEDAFPAVKATAALLVDVQYGTVLYDQSAHEKRYPASITKVMTALLVVEAIARGELEPSTVLTASQSSLEDITNESSSMNLQVGETVTVEELLYCLLVSSANDAANLLAENVSGSIPAFVDAMNTRAQELGMTGTHFANPHGLHQDNHYTTAYDIYLMTRKAMEFPLFQKIVATSRHTVPATNLSKERTLFSTNALISSWRYTGYTYSPAKGVKTGYTPEAGQCLVSYAQSSGRSLIAVVLGADVIYTDTSEDRRQFTESRRLLRHGFNDFKVQTLIGPGALMSEVPVRLSKTVPYVVAQPNKTIEAILPSSFDPQFLKTTVNLSAEYVEAPVKQGQVLGNVSVTYMDVPYGQADLVAANAVPVSVPKLLLARVWGFISSPIGILLVAGVVGYFLFRHIKGASRKPRGAGRKPPSNITPHPGRASADRPLPGKPPLNKPRPVGSVPGRPNASKPSPGKPGTGRPSGRHR